METPIRKITRLWWSTCYPGSPRWMTTTMILCHNPSPEVTFTYWIKGRPDETPNPIPKE